MRCNRAWPPFEAHGFGGHSALHRLFRATKHVRLLHAAPDLSPKPEPLSKLPLKDPAPADLATEDEPRPGRARKPLGWSMITIGVLVAVSATLVWRRDGISGVLEILTHDLALFGGILPRVLAGCLLGAFIAEILPHEKVSRSLGPESGLKGLLIGTAFGAILPGGPFTAYPVASALLTVGADFGATIAMVVSWTLIGYGRAVAWELPIMGSEFTLWRIVISLPLPVLAGALGRFVYVRMYPKKEDEPS